MRTVFIASLAVLMMTAFVPTSPAQVPGGVTDPLCDALPSAAGVPSVCPVGDSLADDGTIVDGWAFAGTAGQILHYFVDNVDSGADLRARVCASATGTGCAVFGDDQTECTVEPPGSYACPEATGALPADDAEPGYYLFVGAWSCCFFSGPFPHNYTIVALELDGVPIPAALMVDDDA